MPQQIYFLLELEITAQHERVRRQYTKSNTEYWSTEIKESRSKRRKLLSVTPNVEMPETNLGSASNIKNLSVLEIKEKLKEQGIQTSVCKLEKLQDILKNVLRNDK